MSFSGKTAVTHSGRRSRRESRQSRLRASTVLHLMAAKSVMNQLACDVNLSEQAELWRLEGGISRSDERFNAPLVPGFTDEFADFPAADAELEITASTSDAVTAPLLRMHEVDAIGCCG